ncbi:MAG: winged helix-turn-helix transcriptional regulator [Candidatus Omnitrophica bacterium]|nr:winged helix-turn-helix transcriptional regulator [Candidatus Omnitrophota bacterium]
MAKAIMDDMAFKIKADFLKGLAHSIRLQVIEYLKNGEASVGKLVKELGVEQSNLSRHLATLRELGILEARQEKTTVYYSIHDHDIFKVLRPIAELLRKKLKRSEKLLESLGKE